MKVLITDISATIVPLVYVTKLAKLKRKSEELWKYSIELDLKSSDLHLDFIFPHLYRCGKSVSYLTTVISNVVNGRRKQRDVYMYIDVCRYVSPLARERAARLYVPRVPLDGRQLQLLRYLRSGHRTLYILETITNTNYILLSIHSRYTIVEQIKFKQRVFFMNALWYSWTTRCGPL